MEMGVGIKDLVDQGLVHVPSNYVHPYQDRPCPSTISNTHDLPIIDLAQLSGYGRPALLQSIAHACSEWGFFQIINHGVPPLVVENLRAASRQFFHQPLEERMRLYCQDVLSSVAYFTGFNPLVENVRDWRDILVLQRGPGERDGFQEAPDICKQPVLEYLAAIEQLAETLYKAIYGSLGLDDEYLDANLPELLRLLMGISYYPPCPDPSVTLGLRGHSDVSCFTILQPDEVPGLQVRKGACWVAVKPVPHAFVVNLGDQTEILTNGKYKSVEHRVITNTDKPRMSIGCFFSPKKDSIIAPLSKIIDEENPPRFKATRYGDYLKNFTSNRHLPNRGSLDFARVMQEPPLL